MNTRDWLRDVKLQVALRAQSGSLGRRSKPIPVGSPAAGGPATTEFRA